MSDDDRSGSGEEEEEYVVERIIKKRFTDDGTVEYFLKWKGKVSIFENVCVMLFGISWF